MCAYSCGGTWGTIHAWTWHGKLPATRTMYPSLDYWVLLTSGHSQYLPAPSLKRETYRLPARKANAQYLPFDDLNVGILGLPRFTNTKGLRFPALPAGNSHVQRAKRSINFSTQKSMHLSGRRSMLVLLCWPYPALVPSPSWLVGFGD